jgi:hypothetical protein
MPVIRWSSCLRVVLHLVLMPQLCDSRRVNRPFFASGTVERPDSRRRRAGPASRRPGDGRPAVLSLDRPSRHKRPPWRHERPGRPRTATDATSATECDSDYRAAAPWPRGVAVAPSRPKTPPGRRRRTCGRLPVRRRRLRTDAPAVYGRPRTAVRHARPWRHGRPGRPATDAPPSDWRQAGCFRLSSRLCDPLHSLRDPMILCMTFITDDGVQSS